MAEEDIIFGKNLHLFGGIEPSNMLKFTSEYRNGVVELTAHLPKDTVVDGQTLCTVAGAVIRRKSDNYPVNEFDGDLVSDVTSSGQIVDRVSNASNGYYYAAFPYTTQGVYNRNPINRAKINIPDAVSAITAKSSYDYTTDTPSIELTVKLPANVSGAVIRRSQNTYPTTETDGDECMDINTSGTYTDNNVVLGEAYYYAVFTYNELGVFNRDISNVVSITCKKHNYLFGYDLDTNDENPFTRVTYPEDTDNSTFASAFMNYVTGEFDYGDWPSTPGTYFMPKPCMLNYEGKVTCYLNPNDYSRQEGGVYSSNITDISTDCNAMMEWPKIYTHREYDDNTGVYKFRCSDVKQGDDWDCWCNYDAYDNIIEHFYTAIYISTYVESVTKGTRLRSISNKSILSGEQHGVFRNRSRYDNSGDNDKTYLTWDIGMMSDYLLIRDLLVMMAKSTDCQTVYGKGRGNGTSNLNSTTGELNDKGLFWGSDDWTHGVKVFGMENWWGNYAQWIAGWACYKTADHVKIKKYSNGDYLYKWDEFEAITLGNGSDMILVTQSRTDVSASNGGYIQSMKNVKDFGVFQSSNGGSATTYECDTFKWNTSTSGSTKSNYAVGGNVTSTFANGPFSAVAVSDIESPSYTGAFLSYKPLIK